MLDFVNGLKAKDAKARFELSVFKEDEKGNYIYLDVKPLLGKDKEQFQQLRMALYGPSTSVPVPSATRSPGVMAFTRT